MTETSAAAPTFDSSKAIKDSGKTNFDDSITARTIVDQMGFGWNLGNTFDASNLKSGTDEGLESETCWGNPKTTDAMISELKQKGFKTIRIPTSWHNHIIDNKYTIDPKWVSRVKEVVDMAIKKGLYVVLNTHHDNASQGSVQYAQGYYPNRNSQSESEKFLVNTWTQITLAFNNGYDHHLIFEGLNEPRQVGDQYEWWFNGAQSGEEAISVVNDFNKLILETIRSSGGNNAKRFYMLTAPAAAYSYTLAGSFRIPDDSRYNPSSKKILISVHMYTPYDFAMNPTGTSSFGDAQRRELDDNFRQLHDKFVVQGYYVVIGEMGVVNKSNVNDRVAWAKYFVQNSRKLGLASIVWDNGIWDNSKSASETFGLFHRAQGSWEPEELVNAYISAANTPIQ